MLSSQLHYPAHWACRTTLISAPLAAGLQEAVHQDTHPHEKFIYILGTVYCNVLTRKYFVFCSKLKSPLIIFHIEMFASDLLSFYSQTSCCFIQFKTIYFHNGGLVCRHWKQPFSGASCNHRIIALCLTQCTSVGIQRISTSLMLCMYCRW